MTPHLILLPVFALAFLTFCVLLIVPIVRITASLKGITTPKDYKLGDSEHVPPWAAVVNRNLVNLCELPVLFYLICLICLITGTISPLILGLSWLYVALRYVHSLIHITINHVFLRMVSFASSSFVLMTIWGVVFWQLFAKNAYL